ncbi:outer membrane protein assembly factor BamB family protein [Rhodopirellula sp. P2]|uniref:outer membrane protein assembly factor BamB family protein n=1 Tax=Rhodopirellula sp. P2 TaxID=2127060 RepID=UPI0023681CC5|nr:PQQ-binding-like beta-propeller repeat protein [Rhodopirellula sp. P2]WDQ19387.1 PQQ-binding-like beta-propeller repeat protein [Rhodopirellula sp. P2]
MNRSASLLCPLRPLHRMLVPLALLLLAGPVQLAGGVLGTVSTCAAGDWLQWRGPEGNNHAPADSDAPIRWDLERSENVIWKTAIPGRGHSSPIVVGEHIFLTTAVAEDETQRLIKCNRSDGRMVDNWIIHRGTLPERIHSNNSFASPSPASDGQNIYVSFHTDDAIVVTSLNLEGKQNWQRKVAEFRPSQFQFGYGASPILVDGLLVVAAEYDGPESCLAALDTQTGRDIWRVARPSNLNFATPIAATIGGQPMVLISGADMINAYDPVTGKELWGVDTATEAICGTVVWDDRRVITSGGNPRSGTWCILGDGSSKSVQWENNVQCYEQSLLTIPNYVFAVADTGVAYCWRTMDGKQMWRTRLFGGGISASPLLVDDRIYVAAEDGTVFVYQASQDRFELKAENKTGDSLFATPVPHDDRLLIRTGVGQGDQRQEYLISVGLR